MSQAGLVNAAVSLACAPSNSPKSQINHSGFHKTQGPPSKGWQEQAATLLAKTAKGFAMSFTMKMSLALYAFIMGVIALGLNGHVPH